MSNHCSLHIDTECEPDVLCPGIFNRTIDYFNSSDCLGYYNKPQIDIVSPTQPCTICGKKLLDGTEAVPWYRWHTRCGGDIRRYKES
jgi:hypothetical protein